MSLFCIKLEVGTNNARTEYTPADPLELKITGSPGADVLLVAVDKGVYVLNNKTRLTQTKVSNYLGPGVDKSIDRALVGSHLET